MTKTVLCRVLVCAALTVAATAARASETVTYTYDAKGRLVKVERTGTVNNGVTTQYTHDHADNRSNVTVTGSPNNSPPP
jgi:YD repeat-containing protein